MIESIEELPHRLEDWLGVANPRVVIDAGKFEQLGFGNVFG